MEGVREYCKVFKKSEQIDRLYVVPSSYPRGTTFRIYILPKDERVIENGEGNPPLNTDAVEVYASFCWNTHGWKYKGKWQTDFLKIYNHRVDEIQRATNKRVEQKESKEVDRINRLLENYNRNK